MGFGFRVSSFGFRVSGFGFQISGFGFRVRVEGFRVTGVRPVLKGVGGCRGFKVQGSQIRKM